MMKNMIFDENTVKLILWKYYYNIKYQMY